MNDERKPSAPLYKHLLSPEELSQLPPPPSKYQTNQNSPGVGGGSLQIGRHMDQFFGGPSTEYIQDISLPNLKVGDEVVHFPNNGKGMTSRDLFERLDIGKVQRIVYHVNPQNQSQTAAVVAFHDEIEGGQKIQTPKGLRYVLLVKVDDVQRLGDFIEKVNSHYARKNGQATPNPPQNVNPMAQEWTRSPSVQMTPTANEWNPMAPTATSFSTFEKTYLSRPCVLMHKLGADHPVVAAGQTIFNFQLVGPISQAVRGTVRKVFSNLGELFIGAEFDRDVYPLELKHGAECRGRSRHHCNRRIAINIVYLTKSAWDSEFRLLVHHNVAVSFEDLFQNCPDPAPPSYADAVKGQQQTILNTVSQVQPLPPPPPPPQNVQLPSVTSNIGFRINPPPSQNQRPLSVPAESSLSRPIAATKPRPMSLIEEIELKFKSKNNGNKNPTEKKTSTTRKPLGENIQAINPTANNDNPIVKTTPKSAVRITAEDESISNGVGQSLAEKREIVAKIFQNNQNPIKPKGSQQSSIGFPTDFSNCPAPHSQPVSRNPSFSVGNKPSIARKPATLPKPLLGKKPELAVKPKGKEIPAESPLPLRKSFLFDQAELEPQKLPPLPSKPKPRLEAIPVEENPILELPETQQDFVDEGQKHQERPNSKHIRPSQPPPPPPQMPAQPQQMPDAQLPRQMPPPSQMSYAQLPQKIPVAQPPQMSLPQFQQQFPQPPQQFPPPPPIMPYFVSSPPPPPPQMPLEGLSVPSNPNPTSIVPDRSNLLDEIRRGKALRKAITNDKSTPLSVSSDTSPTSGGGGGGLASLLMEAIQHRRFGIEEDSDNSDEWDNDNDNNQDNDDAWD